MRNLGGSMADGHALTDPSTLIVVRTGALDRFAALRDAFLAEGVAVIWDRRRAERRLAMSGARPAPERRRRERRGPAPATWDLLDFLVVPGQLALS
jgi:hypothetical protein